MVSRRSRNAEVDNSPGEKKESVANFRRFNLRHDAIRKPDRQTITTTTIVRPTDVPTQLRRSRFDLDATRIAVAGITLRANRISGLKIVVYADMRSGSLGTPRSAREIDRRSVLSLPGQRSRGRVQGAYRRRAPTALHTWVSLRDDISVSTFHSADKISCIREYSHASGIHSAKWDGFIPADRSPWEMMDSETIT